MHQLLPYPLQALLDHLGLRASSALLISPLKDVARRQEAYRLDLVDGSVVKGRVLRRLGISRRIRHWLAHLPTANFSKILAARGRATLEEWVAGDSLAEHPCDASLTASGELLAAIHTVQASDASAADERLHQCLRQFWDGLSRLRRVGLISDPESAHLLSAARSNRPRKPTWCLTHGDFCAANLVSRGGQVCSVDNVTVQPKFAAEDLARTWYRWPMSPEQRRLFLQGYNRLRSADEFFEHQRFWRIVVTVLSAANRLRRRVDGADRIVQRLLSEIEFNGLAA